MFIDRLIEKIKEKNCSIVVGLDPRLELIPEDIVSRNIDKFGETNEAVASAFIEFNKGIIDSICDLVPAVKPQIAFYETYGVEGVKAYKITCEYAREKGLLVIGDVKRGDIGSTSKAYAKAYLGESKIGNSTTNGFYSDSITINPYLGDDCIGEFIEEVDKFEKGIFVLVKTSNPTSDQLQNLLSGDKLIYEHVAGLVNRWSERKTGKYGYSSVGAVVGATYPDVLRKLRKLMPTTYFLVPGYGAQGAGASDIIESFDKQGLGAIINSSRGIIYAYKKEEYKNLDYKESAKMATLKMKEDINNVLKK